MSREPSNDQSLTTLKIPIPLLLIFQSSSKQRHLLYNVSIFKMIFQWDAYFSTIPGALEKSVAVSLTCVCHCLQERYFQCLVQQLCDLPETGSVVSGKVCND